MASYRRAPLQGTRRPGLRRRSGCRVHRSRTVRGRRPRRRHRSRWSATRPAARDRERRTRRVTLGSAPWAANPSGTIARSNRRGDRLLPGGGWSGSEPREAGRDATGGRLDNILGGGREQVVERGVEPGDDALVRPAPRGQRRGEGPRGRRKPRRAVRSGPFAGTVRRASRPAILVAMRTGSWHAARASPPGPDEPAARCDRQPWTAELR